MSRMMTAVVCALMLAGCGSDDGGKAGSGGSGTGGAGGSAGMAGGAGGAGAGGAGAGGSSSGSGSCAKLRACCADPSSGLPTNVTMGPICSAANNPSTTDAACDPFLSAIQANGACK